MGKRLAALHEWVDNLAHGKRIKNYTTICNSSLIGLDVYESKKELPDWWGSAPVHMTPTGYAKIAESIVEQQGVDSNKKEGAVKPLETVKKTNQMAEQEWHSGR